MLKNDSLVVLGRHVRNLLVHDDKVVRPEPGAPVPNSPSPASDNDNDYPGQAYGFIDRRSGETKRLQPTLNALSSGHGSGL